MDKVDKMPIDFMDIMGQIQGQENWVFWGGVLLLGYPFLTILFGELANRLKQAGHHEYSSIFYSLRNVVLPMLFLALLLHKLIGYDNNVLVVKMVDTLLGIAAINMFVAFFNILVFGEGGVASSRQVPKLFLDLLRIFLVLAGAAVVISIVWEVNLGSLITALGVGSVVLGLALQDTLGSLFTGLAILSARNIKVGDWIQVGIEEGIVLSMNWRSIVIRTRDGDNVILPNLRIARELVTNFQAEGKWHVEHLDFELSFDHPPELIKTLLLKAALVTPKVLHDPVPTARILKYDDHAIRYEIRIYMNDYQALPQIRSDFQCTFWYLAKRYKLIFPGRYHQFYQPPKELIPQTYNTVDEIADLLLDINALPRSREQILPLLEKARHLSYMKGEFIIQQGAVCGFIYIITKGRVDISFENDLDGDGLIDDDERIKVYDLRKRQFLVFKTLFNSGPSPLSARAQNDVEVISIPVEALEAYLVEDRELAHEIQQIISSREEQVTDLLVETLPEFEYGAESSDRSAIMKGLFPELEKKMLEAKEKGKKAREKGEV